MEYFSSKVIRQEKSAPGIFSIEITAPGQTVNPGQFYMLKSWQDNLPLMRPISVYKYENEVLTFLYKVVGKGTEALSLLKKGNTIELLGPLGNGFPCDDIHGKIALVAGGVGIPPMYETAKKLFTAGNTVDLYLGYKDSLFCYEDFEDVCHRIFIACESGQEGYKGFVTDLIEYEHYDAVLTCGPEAMMFKIREKCLELKIPVWLSMERRMGCGIGACLVCSCQTEKGMERTCKDGPVFNGLTLKV